MVANRSLTHTGPVLWLLFSFSALAVAAPPTEPAQKPRVGADERVAAPEEPKPTVPPGTSPITLAALPLLNFTSDRGVGYGLYGAIYFQGDEDTTTTSSSKRPPAPYALSIGGQFYQTTGDYAYHKLMLDAPNVLHSGVRINFTAGYETWRDAWYFGTGSRVPRLREADTPTRYYAFDSETYWGFGNVRVPLSSSMDLIAGSIFRNTRVGVYRGSLVADDKPRGVEGGLLSVLYGGLIWDLRDQEPNTTSGLLSEITLRGSAAGLLSDYGFWGVNATHRQWFRLRRDSKWVLATRWILDLQGGDIPFFHAHVLGGSQWLELGGHSALRGLPMGRYRGDLCALGTMELRMHIFDWEFMSQRIAGLLVPFVEGGQVWNVRSEPFPEHMNATWGGGVRILYNEVFIVRFDYAFGLERYLASSRNTSNPKSAIDVNRAIYVIVGHAF